MPEPLVTVLTPFYNTEAYLEECIRSVLGQTYANFEYLLVDNRSTDRSLIIAKDFAQRDPRIRVIENPTHVCQVANYNGALAHVAGKSRFTKVVQADDWIYPTCLTAMVELAEQHASVGLVGAYTLNTDSVYLDGLPYTSAVIDGKDMARRFLRDGLYVFGSPTATLVRSSIVRSRIPFYEEHNPVEDIDVCLAILKTWDFGFVHQVLSYTRRENESITSGQQTYNPLLLARAAGLRRHGGDFFPAHERRACRRAVDREYYRWLGQGALRRRPRAFWDYHREGLTAVGSRIRWPRVAAATVVATLELLLNPWNTAQRILRRVGRASS